MTATTRQGWQRAFDEQMGLWRWYGTMWGQAFLAEGLRVDSQGLEQGTRLLLQGLYGAEPSKLLGASPMYVSGEMVDVVEAASESFEPEPILPSDFLVRDGFLYYDRPIVIRNRFDEPMPLQAFSWCSAISKPGPPNVMPLTEDGTEMQLYGGVRPDKPEDPLHGIALTIYARTPRDRLAPLHFTPWWFDMEFAGNEVDENGKPTGAGWWWRVLQTTLRLMQQRISISHRERPLRAARREAARIGFVDHEVQVIRLRREATHGGPDETQHEANYSHRFIVGGHWRNQWYPSGQVHRQIWISPYVKGPEDKPLIVAPNRAYTWTR